MAHSDKNIVITPAVGNSTIDPKIVFSGADGSTAAQNITVTVYPTSNGTMSFDGSAGQLFSVTNSLTGSIFSVNDISGIPSIEVIDTGLVKIAQYSGNVLLGTATDDTVNKLQVNGNIIGTVIKSNIASGTAPFIVSSTTQVANLNVASAGLATYATTANAVAGANVSGWVANANVANYEAITTATTGNYYLTLTSAITGNVALVGNAAILANLTSGTMYATKFVGDGGLLSNIAGGGGASISNGTSNVNIVASGGNVNTSVGAVANVFVVTITGANIAGTFNVTGAAVRNGRNLMTNYTGASAPATPYQGDEWYDTGSDKLFKYVNDGAGNAWVDQSYPTSYDFLVVANNISAGSISTTGQITSTLTTGTAPFVVTSTTQVANLNVASAGLATYATTANAVAGANVSGAVGLATYATTANAVAGANVSGTVSAATTAGTVTTAAQPNITSTGTLTSLAVTGNISAGNITVTSYLINSVGVGISAAGTVQANATALTKDINVVSTVSAGQGVVLPTAIAGMRILVMNTSATDMKTYPASTAQINALGANVAYTHAAGGRLDFVAVSSTQWYTLNATYS